MAMYYLSRAGQLSTRQQVINHFMTHIFTMRKTSYQIAPVWQLELEMVALDSVIDVLYAPGGSCINLSCRSDFGSV